MVRVNVWTLRGEGLLSSCSLLWYLTAVQGFSGQQISPTIPPLPHFHHLIYTWEVT